MVSSSSTAGPSSSSRRRDEAQQQRRQSASSASTRRSHHHNQRRQHDAYSACGSRQEVDSSFEEECNDSRYHDDDADPLGDSSSVVEGPIFPPTCQVSQRRRRTGAASVSTAGMVPSRLMEAFSCLCIGTTIGGAPADYVETQEEQLAHRPAHHGYYNQRDRQYQHQGGRKGATSTATTHVTGHLWPQVSSSSSSSSSQATPPPAILHSGSGSSSSDGSSRHYEAPSAMFAYPDGSTTKKLVVPTTYVTDRRTGHLVKRHTQPRRQGHQKRPCRSSYVFRPVTLAELQQSIDMANSRSRSHNNHHHTNSTTRTRSNTTQESLDSIYTVRLPEEEPRYFDL
ncbi:expressed unknown protein [Seminavis robusta]|uniref:Uncharacterized protein n=1 Tax=Seminavis robusta TaxID=568900 RepID=A0A9N8HSS9_9STRA|nr:expressed unknown protein [Seminavis robusta]|eukprot:Sro1559_g282490.1 n/a (340) ;mRNA; f:18227-19246